MSHSLILGGTKGLGRSLAIQSLARGITPIVTGRSVSGAEKDPALSGAEFCQVDIAAPDSPYRTVMAIRGRDVRWVFWNAGIFMKKPLAECAAEEIQKMIALHLTGPIETLKHVHRAMLADKHPYHLIVTASTSSYRMREHETIYAMTKAAKAQFTRHFAKELTAQLPDSQTLLVNPGGMKSGFLAAAGVDVSKMMDTGVVAAIIWDRLMWQTDDYEEINILRQPDGTPRVVEGPQVPEIP